MKKKIKKLVLSRETLADLDLQQISGGATMTCQPFPCEWSGGRATCTTCNLTCTTNYC